MKSVYLDISNYGNNRKKLLQEVQAQEEHNLLCYSSNLLCTSPKIGYDTEWGNTKEKLNVFTQMVNELPDENGICTYVGRIIRSFKSDEGYIVCFEISNSLEKYGTQSILHLFHIIEEVYYDFIPTYYSEYDERREKDLPNVVELKVKLNVIEEIRWVENYDY